MTDDEFQQVLPEIRKVARVEAFRLVRQRWFGLDEREDLEQELQLHAWRKRDQFALVQGSNQYLRTAIRNRGKDLVTFELRERRDRRSRALPPDGASREEASPFTDSTPFLEPVADLQVDLDRVLSRLRPAKRRFAWLLAELRVPEAARAVGISVSTGWRWKNEIKAHLEDYGLASAHRQRRPDGPRPSQGSLELPSEPG